MINELDRILDPFVIVDLPPEIINYNLMNTIYFLVFISQYI